MLKEYFLYLITCDGCKSQKPIHSERKLNSDELKLPKGWEELRNSSEIFCKEECYKNGLKKTLKKE